VMSVLCKASRYKWAPPGEYYLCKASVSLLLRLIIVVYTGPPLSHTHDTDGILLSDDVYANVLNNN